MFYVSPIATTMQKPITDSLKMKSDELKHIIRENHLTTKEDSKKRREELQNQKTNKMAVVKSLLINNNTEYKWTKFSNSKA